MTFDPERAQNNEDIEAHWAMKAFQHAETYFKMLTTISPKKIKLTPLDDLLYISFRKEFPTLNVKFLNEDLDFKSNEAKSKWREFISKFENQVEDFNFGTLIRTRSDEDYGPENSFFVPRIQFVCVEVARNKEGANESVFSSRDFKYDDSSAETEQERLEREKEMARLEQKIAANLNYKQNGARN